MPEIFSTVLDIVSLIFAGDTTSTYGSVRSTPAMRTSAAAALIFISAPPELGRTIISMPIPEVCVRLPFNMPNMIAAIDRIMTTSMATANTLMMERSGRWTRLPMMSLFIKNASRKRRRSSRGKYKAQDAATGACILGASSCANGTPRSRDKAAPITGAT